ncbi:hypothetical protein M2282_003356 [Variovorax boronicumulans]|uniref:hypothetical protein n=1 Tax=Variovorax boronicumulans TaxID=436515 RepID=UPI00247623FF|nr:hypothetical protein [Variovorax boronicumulans]MDH6168205.1 hypothetical protein [Variovorax boronicumulans]
MFFLSHIRHARFRELMFFVIAGGAYSFAFAGASNGPFVVWVNLDKSANRSRVNEIISDFANSSKDCDGAWLRSPMLYMKKRPPLITDELIESVFLKKDTVRKKYLNAALKNYKNLDLSHLEGLDGVIVYTNSGAARMMSLTTGKTKIETLTLSSHGHTPEKEDIEGAFCALLPAITRAP